MIIIIIIINSTTTGPRVQQNMGAHPRKAKGTITNRDTGKNKTSKSTEQPESKKAPHGAAGTAAAAETLYEEICEGLESPGIAVG